MSTNFSIESVDTDGTIRTAAEDAGAFTDRRELIRRGVLAGGAATAVGMFGPMLSPAEAAIVNGRRSAKNDIAVLKYALTLEYLESAFYLEAIKNIKFANPQLEFFARVVGQHEKDHVNTLRTVLGKKSFQSPGFTFGAATSDEKTFAATAQVLEDTGVAAYAGQGGNLQARNLIIAALSIHSVEARHAAWIRYINGGNAPGSGANAPAPVAFDVALTERKVLAAVTATGFLG